MEEYLYERAEKRFQEMKNGRYISHDDSMTFICQIAKARKQSERGETIVCRNKAEMQRYFDNL